MASSGGGSAAVARRLYLSVYNWVVFFGWSVLHLLRPSLCLPTYSQSAIFIRFVHLDYMHVVAGRVQVLYGAASALLLETSGHEAVYAAVERPLLFAQTAAVMEVHLHARYTMILD
jgi:very-long-chain (3R)-3-hydroxyacyl-CoA dehydratase